MISPSTTKYANTIRTGDAIGICFQNRLYLGIFLDVGFKQNVRYFSVSQHKLDWYRKCLTQKSKVYKEFINRPLGSSVVKIDINELDQESRRLYEEIKDVLEQIGEI